MPIVKLTQKILAHQEFDIISKKGSHEKFELFKSQPEDFDVVIIGMGMPYMRSDQLTKNLLMIRPKLPIMPCKEYSESITQEEAFSLGFRNQS